MSNGEFRLGLKGLIDISVRIFGWKETTTIEKAQKINHDDGRLQGSKLFCRYTEYNIVLAAQYCTKGPCAQRR